MKSDRTARTAKLSSSFRNTAKAPRRWVLTLMVALGSGTGLPMAHAQATLFSFNGSNGNIPAAGVVRDSAGNLYGTTFYGGLGSGVVFKLEPSGKETTLHKFTCGSDGCSSAAPLILDAAGNLYGTTVLGGDPVCQCGVAFKMDKKGNETVLHAFTGGQDGANPSAGLIRDAAGNLYGTAPSGGHGNGMVFKLSAAGKETILYRFRGGADGSAPSGGLIRDSAGNLYGTTSSGGYLNNGTIFKVDATGHETVLYRFRGGVDGSAPVGGVIRDSAGTFYGVTGGGGNTDCTLGNEACGTVFKLDSSGTKTTLHSFDGDTGPSDGAFPAGGLVRDSAGNLYGTTSEGSGGVNVGTIFEITAAGEESVLSYVEGVPAPHLIFDSAGNLYGTTEVGGPSFNPCGTVFEFTPGS